MEATTQATFNVASTIWHKAAERWNNSHDWQKKKQLCKDEYRKLGRVLQAAINDRNTKPALSELFCALLEKLNRIRPIIKDYTKKYKEKDYRSKTSLTRHLKRDCYDPLIEISSVVMNHI